MSRSYVVERLVDLLSLALQVLVAVGEQVVGVFHEVQRVDQHVFLAD